MKTKTDAVELKVLTSSKSYFSEIVSDAIEKRKLNSPPYVQQYLVELLDTNIHTQNTIISQTLAEMLLRAASAEKNMRLELLKKLGDTTLYISGVFGDSLRRKIIDVDYYADMGGIAYGHLALEMGPNIKAKIFKEFADRFMDYVDVLTCVGQSTGIQSNSDILRLYERYIATGSPLAKEQLVEKGIFTDIEKKKVSQ